MAHSGHDHVLGFAPGFLHPLGGLDHLLAAIAVGLYANRLNIQGRLVLGAGFIAAVGMGGVLGLHFGAFSALELFLALSLTGLGTLLLVPLGPCGSVTAGFVAVFGLAHGFAHGAEISSDLSAPLYLTGVCAGTAAVVAVSLLAGNCIERLTSLPLQRWAGAAIAAVGVACLF
jgi:urease accessory protein